jgi:mono/diheme cytochrome c family protein
MRSLKYTALAAFALLLAVTLPSLAGQKGPDGKALYKQNCRVCHDKGSPNGEFSPMSLIGDQWDTFFNTKLAPSHKDVVVPNTGKKLFEILTPEEIKTIHKFCVDHAADSEQPQTCG